MAYTRLLRAYYHAEKAIPQGQQYRLAKASTPAQRRAVDAVLVEFFALEDDGCFHQKRADEEIERYRDKQAKAKRSAEARWQNQKPHTDGNANAMRTHTERSAEAMLSSLQTPDTSLASKMQTAASPPIPRPALEPATPPPPFDGLNAETLNGRCVVTLADSFELPADWGLDAERLGFNPGEVFREAEKFRQFFTAGKGKGTRRSVKGWRQSWSNWLGKASESKR